MAAPQPEPAAAPPEEQAAPPVEPPAPTAPIFAEAILVEPPSEAMPPVVETPSAAPPATTELPPLPDLQDVPPEELVQRFESDWLNGRRPELDDYLPASSAARDRVLGKLVRIDLECRIKAGEDAALEKYLERFPGLTADRAVLLDLVLGEFETRRRWQPNLAIDDACGRFPALADDLRARVAPPTPEGESSSPRDTVPAPAEPQPVPTPLQPPGFEILEVLSETKDEGCYRARETETGRVVALRTFRAENADARRRAVDLYRRVGRLQDPHLVAVHDSAAYGPDEEGRYFLASAWVDGVPLHEETHGWPIAPGQAAEWVETLAAALHAAHGQELVHGGVAPDNVIVTREPAGVHLLGLGSPPPRFDFDHLSPADALSARISYLAPEQTQGEAAMRTPATDVYALGVLLHELLTGRPPFRAPTVGETVEQVRSLTPPLPSEVQPGIPTDLDYICRRCLEKAPMARYATAQELAADLRRFTARTPVLSSLQRVTFWAKQRPLLAGLLVALALCLFFLIVSLSRLSQVERELHALPPTQEAPETPAAGPERAQ
jgi:hypothetical protein